MAASKPTAKLSSESHFLSHLGLNWRPYRLIWAVSLLTDSTSLLPLDSACSLSKFIHSLHRIGTLWHARKLVQSFTSFEIQTGTASTAFVENKLSRCLLSLSPLFTTHPRSLQRTLVRPSIYCYIHFSLVMNSSQRFVSWLWEIFFGPFRPVDFTTSSRFRFNFSPLTKLVDPLYHKYSVIFWFRLPMELSCPVSRKFPHCTLHYQSRSFFSSLVGGSTFFNPDFMYEFTRKWGNSFVRVVWSSSFSPFSSFPPRTVSRKKLPFLFHLNCRCPFSSSLPQRLKLAGFHNKPYRFRSPLLSVSLLISLNRY